MLRFLLLAATALLAAAQCPVFDVKPSLRKTVAGGKVAQLTVKVTNRDLAVTNGGFGLALPNGVTYKSVRVSPKLSPAPGRCQVSWVQSMGSRVGGEGGRGINGHLSVILTTISILAPTQSSSSRTTRWRGPASTCPWARRVRSA